MFFITDLPRATLNSQNFNAKLSDFGLARDGPTGDKSHVSTRVMGTYGYAAPEYLSTGIFSALIILFLTPLNVFMRLLGRWFIHSFSVKCPFTINFFI